MATSYTPMLKKLAQDLKDAVDKELTKRPDLQEDWVERLDNMGIELELLLSYIEDHKQGGLGADEKWINTWIARPIGISNEKCYGILAEELGKAYEILESFAKRGRDERVLPYVYPRHYIIEELQMIEE